MPRGEGKMETLVAPLELVFLFQGEHTSRVYFTGRYPRDSRAKLTRDFCVQSRD